MPEYPAPPAFAAPVPVETGDIVQNTGRHMILVCAAAPAADGDAVEVLPNKGVTITAATSVAVRCVSRHGSTFKVIRGI